VGVYESSARGPGLLSLSDLRACPSQPDFMKSCAKEGGRISRVDRNALADVLNEVGVLPQARYVAYYSADRNWWGQRRHGRSPASQTLLTGA